MEVAVGARPGRRARGPTPGRARTSRRAAGLFIWSQVEAGHSCPISMTYAVIPALRHNPGLAAALRAAADRPAATIRACARR